MLAFDRRGSGEPIVLIHGVAHRRQAWDRVVDLLVDDYEVITLDLPGHGESPDATFDGIGPKDAFRLALEELFEHLGIERPTIVGNSLGGLIALEAAHDELAGSVIGFSPAGFWTRREFVYIRGLFLTMVSGAFVLRPVLRWIAHTRIGRRIMLSWLAKHPTRVTPEQAIGDARGMVRAIPTLLRLLNAAYPFESTISPTVPVTIAWSQYDRVLFPRQAQRAAHAIPHASVFTVHDVGHVPMLDDPALVAQTIRDHMAARPASPSAA